MRLIVTHSYHKPYNDRRYIMALVSQAIKNLKGGVSQQPDILRYDDQGAEQVNAFSSEVEGLQKRPPTVNIGRLENGGWLGHRPLCHIIDRDESEKYATFFTEEGYIGVVNLLTGAKPTVHYPKGNAYLQTGNPREHLRMVTVADYTFIINRAIHVGSTAEKSPMYYEPKRNGLIIVRGGQYGRTFKVFVNGTAVASYTTPLGDQPNHSLLIDAKFILDELAQQMLVNLPGWIVQPLEGQYMWVQAPSTSEITSLTVEDGYNKQLMTCITTSVVRTTDLPTEAPVNYQVRITGDPSAGQDDYWVQFDAQRKVWAECAAPDVYTTLDSLTMPWTLIRQADGSFVFKPVDWAKKRCGDDDTNPWPSFVSSTISDVFFYRNRLGFLSGENVILSESGDYFNFFPESIAVTADSDPIDVAVSTNKISILKYAIPFGEELMLWSDKSQFVLSADGILTPSSVKLNVTTEFEVSDKARPLVIGRGVYYVAPRANFSSIRRFYSVQDVTQVKNSEDVSSHVPSYIPNGIHHMCGSTTENFLLAVSEQAQHKIFVYKFLYLNEELAQQSWSHWDFGEGSRILCCALSGSTLYLILDTVAGVYLEKMTFTQHTKDLEYEPYRLFMDRKTAFSIPAQSFNFDTYLTTFHLKDVYGATPTTGTYYLVDTLGSMLKLEPPEGGWGSSDGKIELVGDRTGTYYFIGEEYEMKYHFSKFLIKSTDSQGKTATEDIGRLQLRRAWVNYENSGNFAITVNNQGNKFTYNMTGQRLGTNEFILGEETLDTGQFRYPVAGSAHKLDISLTSSTPNPVAIIGAGWEGNYVRRSSGI